MDWQNWWFKNRFKIILGIIFTSSFLLILLILNRPDGKLHVIFCDVGQGDGILIKTPGQQTILVDGGPDAKILSCLGSKLPFWQREIDLLILTHPEADHMVGQIEVLRRYKVNMILNTGATNNTPEYQAYLHEIELKKVAHQTIKRGQQINLGKGVGMSVLWPTDNVINVPTMNETSLVLRLYFGQFCVFLTGDAPEVVQQDLVNFNDPDLEKTCSVFKVAHHGSKTGTSEKLLEQIKPKLAVISVGKYNKFGNPTPQTIEKLSKAGISIKRTDRDGAIEVVSDGKSWYTR